jgi:hypothetical protein
MYKWKIDIYLKSGVKLECIYSGPEDTTLDVLNKTFAGKQITDVIGFEGRTDMNHIYVLVGEVAAFDIYMEEI